MEKRKFEVSTVESFQAHLLLDVTCPMCAVYEPLFLTGRIRLLSHSALLLFPVQSTYTVLSYIIESNAVELIIRHDRGRILPHVLINHCAEAYLTNTLHRWILRVAQTCKTYSFRKQKATAQGLHHLDRLHQLFRPSCRASVCALLAFRLSSGSNLVTMDKK